MKKHQFIRNLALQIIGLFLMTFGVAFSVKANLGTSPIASLPYVLSLMTPLSMGLLTFIMQTTFVAIQIVLLRSHFRLVELLQIPVAIIFGYFTDVTLSLVANLEPNNYFTQWLFCLIGIIVVAFGTFLCIKSKLPMPAGGGLVKAFTEISSLDFGRLKITFDVTLVLCSIVASLLYFHALEGIREGTIASAFLVGIFIRFFSKHIHWFDEGHI